MSKQGMFVHEWCHRATKEGMNCKMCLFCVFNGKSVVSGLADALQLAGFDVLQCRRPCPACKCGSFPTAAAAVQIGGSLQANRRDSIKLPFTGSAAQLAG